MPTTHIMQLHDGPFEKISNGTKKIEIRINDEKRRAIKIGDHIVFTKRTNQGFKIETIMKNLIKAKTFEELFSTINLKMLDCPTMNSIELTESMHEFYSESEEKQYGVIGIEIQKIIP
jgi:ASC-1-like (ASCH) protein